MRLKFTFLVTLLSLVVYAQTAPAYYSGINFEKNQNDLKAELTKLITETHKKQISYNDLRDLLPKSDVDPQNSSKMLAVYGSKSSGKHQRSITSFPTSNWNREHVYAKSLGTPNLGTSGPGSDGHHLRPADITLNSDRGNLKFDDGTGVTAYKTNRGGWYPGDEWKGDIARILMYMYVRYQDQCKPLNIAFVPNTYSEDFSDILLKWNAEDPVSDFEINRNNVVAETQGNRNPFIDNPYLATLIWGGPDAENTWPETIQGGNPIEQDSIAPTTPTNLMVSDSTSTSISLSWTASTDNIAVSKYDIYLDGIYNSTSSSNNSTITDLQPSTDYSVYIIAKDRAGNSSIKSESINIKTKEKSTDDTEPSEGGSCGTEDFEKIPTSNSAYTERVWTNRNITWTATAARTDQTDDNRAITIRNGSLTSSTISGGIGSLSVRTALLFTGTDGTFTLNINGEEVGKIAYSATPQTIQIDNINIEGNSIIELVNDSTTNRVRLDNLSWTCYSESLATDDINKNNVDKISIYPNPIKNYEFYIKGLKQTETIYIYNLNGQLVQTIEKVNSSSKIKLNRLPKGIYIVKTNKQSSKIIVE